MLENLINHGDVKYFLACSSLNFLVVEQNIGQDEIVANAIDFLTLVQNESDDLHQL